MTRKHELQKRLWHVRLGEWVWVKRYPRQIEMYVVETASGEIVYAHEDALADNIDGAPSVYRDNICDGELAHEAMRHWLVSRARQQVIRFERQVTEDRLWNAAEQGCGND